MPGSAIGPLVTKTCADLHNFGTPKSPSLAVLEMPMKNAKLLIAGHG